MGSIKRFNLGRIIKEYNCDYFFETGTWKGDGVAYANKFPFKKIYSSEIIPEIAQRARARFSGLDNIEILEGNSTDVFKAHLPNIKGNCIFWLDAHFPGAEEGINKYNDYEDEQVKLPLEEEINQIKSLRKGYTDVILIDDLRIYETGNFASGNMPEGILPPKRRNSLFVNEAFGKTHKIIKSFRDEGYILVLDNEIFTKNNTGIRKTFFDLRNKLFKQIY
ncbi:hypothetical protein [Flavihumibacter profundi]|uniref:hypothetical protein n=1 Tax=Flavihumibacter profundi TaxID=2716883 RepID=UPI001CC5CDF0|nr:hypothetical protein [Flavihumibacter profundi]MBZ5856369.1 hypothetical protein [Flavihumibacter profundi]